VQGISVPENSLGVSTSQSGKHLKGSVQIEAP
jgi:hypothetical protein